MSDEAYGLMQAVCLLGITLVLLHWRWSRNRGKPS